MAFPSDVRGLEVGIFIGGEWVNASDVGGGIRARDGVQIKHGRRNWSSVADPAMAGFTLDNRDGRWSPDYSAGAYSGNYRLNLPCRVGVREGVVHLAPTDASDEVASTPDTAVLDITGDIDVRVEFESNEDFVAFADGGKQAMFAMKGDGSDGWQWGLYELSSGVIISAFLWWEAGGTLNAYATDATGTDLTWRSQWDRMALRFTLDVSTGEGIWYTSDRIDGTWTQLGNSISVSGATDIAATTDPLRVGGVVSPASAFWERFPGRIYAFELRDGIDGTVVADPDFTAQTVGAASFTDDAGRTWTIGTGGRISDTSWRFHGDLSSLPVRWTIDGADVTAPVEATGILSRLRQANQIDSPLRIGVTRSPDDYVQYWPCEEAGDSTLTQFAAAVGSAPLSITGTPTPARNTDFKATKPLPELGSDIWTAVVDDYTSTNEWQVRWLMSVPTGFTGSDVRFLRIETDELDWEIQYRDTTDGQLRYVAYNGATATHTSAWISFEATGKPMRMTFSVTDNGSNVDVTLLGQAEDEPNAGGVSHSSPLAGEPGKVTLIRVNSTEDADGWGFGQITLQSEETSSSELADELNAYDGEAAARRIQRLCRQEGIKHRIYGDPDDSEPMGIQRPGTLESILQQCAETDLGLLHDARDTVGVGYRTRASMVGQGDTLPPILEGDVVDYWTAADLTDTADQTIPNRVTGGTAATLGSGTGSDASDPTITLDPTPKRVDPDGTNDYIQAPYTPTFTASTGEVTVIYAGYWDSVDTTRSRRRLVSFEDDNFDGLTIQCSAGGSAFPSVTVGGSVGGAVEVAPPGSPSLADDELFAVAAVVDDGTLRTYLHGEGLSTAESIAGVGTITFDPGTIFARAYDKSAAATCGWGDLMVINRALTAAELKTVCAWMLDRAARGTVVLDYDAGHLARSPQLDRDIQGFANDITVENANGATGAAVLNDGSALSISQPPTGAGPYRESFPVNGQDGRLRSMAEFRLALSAVDEPRVSNLAVAWHHAAVATHPRLPTDLLDMRIGDQIAVLNNLAVALGSTSLVQIVQGYTETIEVYAHTMDLLTTPGSPWAAAADPTILGVTATNRAHGIGTQSVTNPIQSTSGTVLAICVAPGPSNESSSSGAFSAPTGGTVRFDYGGNLSVPRVRAWTFTEDGSASYTFGWTTSVSEECECILIGLDGAASQIAATATPIVAGASTSTPYPTLATSADDLVIAVGVQQTTDEMTAGPTGYTQLVNSTATETRHGAAAHSDVATGSTETPPNSTWDGSVGAHVQFCIGFRA